MTTNWSGDYTLPRLRAKLALSNALHPDVEPEYAQLYRTDLGAITLVKKDDLGSSDFGGLQSSYTYFMSRTSTKDSLSSTGAKVLGKSRSTPTIGVKLAERYPARGSRHPHGLELPPAQAMVKSASKSSFSSLGPDERRDYEREKAATAACKAVWSKSHGFENNLKTEIKKLREEEPGLSDAALLAKLKPIKPPPGLPMQMAMDVAAKSGAKVYDWANPEWDGATLFLKALRSSSLELAMYFHSQGADPLVKDSSRRGAVHWAAYLGDYKALAYLVACVPDLNLQEEDAAGDTPLHLAAFQGHLNIVRLLVTKCYSLPEQAKNISKKNGGGFTPLELATARRMWHVSNYLSDSNEIAMDLKRGGQPIQHMVFYRPCNWFGFQETYNEQKWQQGGILNAKDPVPEHHGMREYWEDPLIAAGQSGRPCTPEKLEPIVLRALEQTKKPVEEAPAP